jgi:hypothetical protein
MSSLISGIIIGIVASLIAAIIYSFVHGNLYSRYKYRKIIGNYSHSKGKVEIIHVSGNNFKAKGLENKGVKWESHLRYYDNTVFYGVYDWDSEAEENQWGEHHLHILPNGNITVIWINKSQEKESSGKLIWKKMEEKKLVQISNPNTQQQ